MDTITAQPPTMHDRPRPRFLHRGVDYATFLGGLHAALNPRSYLEIGVHKGRTLALAKCPSVGVDPKLELNPNFMAGKSDCHLYQMTSDRFFQDVDIRSIWPRGIDLVFLDGLHQYEVLLRDFINAERHCRRDSVIVLHDCLPFLEEIAERSHQPAQREYPEYKSYWAGDVWKTLVILRANRPDLKIVCLDCPPTGLVLITNLDPSSRVLFDRYHALVAELAETVLDAFGIEKLFWLANLRPSQELVEPAMLQNFIAFNILHHQAEDLHIPMALQKQLHRGLGREPGSAAANPGLGEAAAAIGASRQAVDYAAVSSKYKAHITSPKRLPDKVGKRDSVDFITSRFILLNGYFFLALDLVSQQSIETLEILGLDFVAPPRVSRNLPSFAIQRVRPDCPAAGFAVDGLLQDMAEQKSANPPQFSLRLELARGRSVVITRDELLASHPDQHNPVVHQFWELVRNSATGSFLELGGRGEASSRVRRLLPKGWHYRAADIKAGPNVDLVCDVHEISNYLEPGSVDVVYSSASLEHFFAPWLVVAECNKILRTGGIFFAAAPNVWPLHGAPWDFWRFMESSWGALLNQMSGFEVVATAVYEPCMIVPVIMGQDRPQMPGRGGAWLATCCLAVKTGENFQRWRYSLEAVDGMYPG